MSDNPTKKIDDDDELAEEYDLASLPIMPKGRYAPERRLRKKSRRARYGFSPSLSKRRGGPQGT
jgi:hypothetical protein